MRKYRRAPRRKIVRRRRVARRRPVIRRSRALAIIKPEVKTVIYSPNTTTFNQYINSTGDCLRLIPPIAQGTTGVTRIGDMVNLKSLHVRGVITLGDLAYELVQNCRIGVRVMIVRAKRYMDWNVATSQFGTDYTKLLEGSTNGFGGYLYDFTTPINKDFFSVIYDRRFYLSRSLTNAPTTTSYVLDKSYCAFSKKLNFHRRKLQYDSSTNSSTDPINYPYFMLCSYVKLDGSAPALGGTTGINFQYTTTAKFTDY